MSYDEARLVESMNQMLQHGYSVEQVEHQLYFAAVYDPALSNVVDDLLHMLHIYQNGEDKKGVNNNHE